MSSSQTPRFTSEPMPGTPASDQPSGLGSAALTDQERRLADAIARRAPALLDDLRLHVNTCTGHGGFDHPSLHETRERFRTRLERLGARTELVPGQARPDWLWGGDDTAAVGPRSVPPTMLCRRVDVAGDGAGAGAGRTSPRILIAGHLDTVHHPTSPFRELSIEPGGKRATGPGCVDMKGGLVIAIAALEALDDAGIGCRWTFVANSDEETGSYHSEAALSAAAREHDVGLALEPAMTNGELAVSRGGSGQFFMRAKGKSAHVGRDFAAGVSAVNTLARGIVAAAGLSDAAKGVCVNIGPLQGGTATNVVPDEARAWGNVRFPSPDLSAALERDLLAIAGPDPSGSGGRLEVKTSLNRAAKPMTPAVERLGLAARNVAEALGQRLPFGTTGGVCDGNILQAAGLPTIDTLGVRGGKLHTPEEWIELPSLVERCQLLAILIARLSSGAARV